jgi:hypothetical protein
MPESVKTKYEYRTTSVKLHASSMVLNAALCAVVCGKLYAMPHTSRNRLATCISVVRSGARTMPGSHPLALSFTQYTML